MKTTIDPLVTKYFNSFGGKKGKTVQPLPKKEEKKLLSLWRNKKDKKALDAFLLANIKFVVTCANKFSGYADGKTITINDLIQAGNEGLIHAVKGFKPSKNVRFISYAFYWINAYVRKYIYENISVVRLPLNNRIKSLIDYRWSAFDIINS